MRVALLCIGLVAAQFAIDVERANVGNYYIALTNSLWAARHCNGTCVVLQTHADVVYQPTAAAHNTSGLHPLIGSFYYDRIAKSIPAPKPTMRDRIDAMCPLVAAIQTAITTHEPPDTQRFSGEDTLVAHVRSGDIFTTAIHPQYWQPPLGYYQFAARVYRRIVVCAQSGHNPVARALHNWCRETRGANNCLLRIDQPLAADVAFLMAAHNLVVGRGSFGVAIYALSARLRRVYYERTSGQFAASVGNQTRCGVDRLLIGVQLTYNTTQVTRGEPWRATHDQVNMLLMDEHVLTGLDVERIGDLV